MIDAGRVRGAFANACEEAEFFDGMPRGEVSRLIHQFETIPDSVLVSFARHVRAIKKEQTI